MRTVSLQHGRKKTITRIKMPERVLETMKTKGKTPRSRNRPAPPDREAAGQTTERPWYLAGPGRPRLYQTPEDLWVDCLEYFEDTSKRKWKRKDWVGKDAKMVTRETETPFSLTGLFVFLDINRQTWTNYRDRDGFLAVCTRVEQIMFTQKFEGASVGAYNANIIARDLGLKENIDASINDNRKTTADLFPAELNKDNE